MDDEVTGKAKGGVARAAKLTPEERTGIAQKAAVARWGNKTPQAIRKGNFEDDFGIDVDCYVLNDAQKTAVISQRGMGAALGLSPQSGARLPRVVSGKAISQYIGPELKEKLNNPIIFQGVPTVQGGPSLKQIYGFDVTLLIDVCKAIIAAEADGKLLKNQQNMVRQAHIILNASAKAGIKGLVYAITGYDITKEEVIAAFKFFVRQEAREYEKEFPDQLYVQWYRLYDLPKPERNKPWKFKHLTVNHVYVPLAKSNGKIHELVVAQRAASGERGKRLHQFLAEIGVKALRTHLGQLLGIAQISKNQKEYEKHVNMVFGDQQEFDFDEPTLTT